MSTPHTISTDMQSEDPYRPARNRPTKTVIRPSELGAVEVCLETVVVPGELSSWATAPWQACEAEGPALRREIKHGHADDLAKLISTDTNQSQHVSQMQAEDVEILKHYDEFETRVRRLRALSGLAGPREDKFDEGVRAIVDEGLALVIRVRKQERALSTWLSEAFHRDTGVGD